MPTSHRRTQLRNFSDQRFFDLFFDSTEWLGSLHCDHGGLRRARPKPSHVETMRLRVPSVPSWPGGRARGQFPLSLLPPRPFLLCPPLPPSAPLLTLVSLSLSLFLSPLTTTGQAFWARRVGRPPNERNSQSTRVQRGLAERCKGRRSKKRCRQLRPTAAAVSPPVAVALPLSRSRKAPAFFAIDEDTAKTSNSPKAPRE
jgi:hypothetical protein